MPRDEVQREVDELAESLQRSVVINDAGVRILYASRHFGDEDAVRVRAVLDRDAGAEAAGHVLRQGILQWSRPRRIPPHEPIGLRGRIGMPLRWDGEVLGMLLVMDADGSATDETMARIDAVAATVVQIMAVSRDEDDGLLATTVAEALDARSSVRLPALERLPRLLAAPLAGRAAALALRVGHAAPAKRGITSVALRRTLEAAAARIRGTALTSVDGTSGRLVVVGPPEPAVDAMAELAATLAHDVQVLLGPAARVHAGVGSVVPDVGAAWRSAREADLAAESARRSAGSVVARWDGAGIATLLARVPEAELDASAVPDELLVLRAEDPSGRLLQTLQTYLDLAGSAPAAAQALFVHRTTLYYRLDRIRALTGADLDDGRVRLRLHVGLAVLESSSGLLDL